MTPTDPLKIARVVTRMNIGGPARHVTILAERCRPDFETALLAGETEGREGELNRTGVSVVRVPHLRRRPSPLADLRALIWLVRYLRRESPAIVATHTAKAGLLGRVAAVVAGVPVRIHTFHGHVLEGYFGRVQASFYLALERLMGRFTTQFVAISPEIERDLDRLGIGRGKTTVVRLGLELNGLSAGDAGRLRRELDVPAGAHLVGIVGRLVPIKAIDVFLPAAEEVAHTDPGARFAIVGDGELWDELHAQVSSRGLERRVHFTGWRSDLADVYSALDVVVCCSRNEGTPVALIEACAAGRPVVGTTVGGIPDVIEGGVNGILVPPGDPHALASAISELLADPVRRQSMGARGRQRVLERYSADRMVTELKNLYQSLLTRAGLCPQAA